MKTLVTESFLNKVTGARSATLLKKRLLKRDSYEFCEIFVRTTLKRNKL